MASWGRALGAGEGLRQLQPRLARALGAGARTRKRAHRRRPACRARPVRDEAAAGVAALVRGAPAAGERALRVDDLHSDLLRPGGEPRRARRRAGVLWEATLIHQ